MRNEAQSTDAVEVDTFATAAEREARALLAYRVAKERAQDAENELHRLSCRTPFTYEVAGPHPDEGDVYVIDENCTRAAGHEGEHRGDFDDATTAGREYVKAAEQFEQANAHTGEAMNRWEDAEEALDGLRCNGGDKAAWPCVLRRGHDGSHDHPTELHLVL